MYADFSRKGRGGRGNNTQAAGRAMWSGEKRGGGVVIFRALIYCHIQELIIARGPRNKVGGGALWQLCLWWKAQLCLPRNAAPSPVPRTKAHGPSLQAVSWGPEPSTFGTSLAPPSPWSWGENHILNTAGICGCSFKMKTYSPWSLASAQGNLC